MDAWIDSFYPFQQEWLLDWSRFSLTNKSRQIGRSHVYGAQAVLWGLFGEPTAIISLGEREAKEVLEKAQKHAEVLAGLGSQWAKAKFRANELSLASGGKVIALPNSSSGRSYASNVIIDEFAYFERPEERWDAAAGTVTHGYRLHAGSTPNGEGNFWFELYAIHSAELGFTRHEVTIDQAIADGFPVKLESCWQQARGDIRVFEQIFRGKFTDNDQQYLPDALIRACETKDEPPKGVPARYAGLDLGRINDLTARVIVDVYPDNSCWASNLVTRKSTTDADIDALVAEALNIHKCEKVFIDETGLGSFPVQRLRQRYPKQVVGVTFTQNSKEELATRLYQIAAEGRLKWSRLMSWAPALAKDLASIRRIVTKAGNVTYDAARTELGHADRAWALALALYKAKPARGAATFNFDY